MQRDLQDVLSVAIEKSRSFNKNEIVRLLSLAKPSEIEQLFNAAREAKSRYCARGVAVRALIEAGNVCVKDCAYCGIRKSNIKVERYELTRAEILSAAIEAKSLGYASLVIQSGEIESEKHTNFIEEVLNELKPMNLGITLSLGEQSFETFKRWREAGATRYLLRIETTNQELYARLHPSHPDQTRRRQCLKDLRAAGYQVGTGVMCALPTQTFEDLANDILFFGEIDADMIGMGPYIPHADTPLATTDVFSNDARLLLGLKMIAITRLYLHDVNIAASTALQALRDDGRERGIFAGANVIMPNVTDVSRRRQYQLYDGKPMMNETARKTRDILDARLKAIGEFLLYNDRGDSRHFAKRMEK